MSSKEPSSKPRLAWRRSLLLIALLVLVGASWAVWRATKSVDTPPQAVFEEIEPERPLFTDDAGSVTFVLADDQGNIPTFFLFAGEDQKVTAIAINTLRGTPNEQGVEIRFEAVRFRRDESDPDRLWVRAVGIVNETEGKTPISLSELESGQPLDVHFHDEIRVPLVAHVIYDIFMTIQYDAKRQELTLTNATGSIRWKMLGTDAFDEGALDCVVRGRRGEYPEKPLLTF
jgi:hypothetical protein